MGGQLCIKKALKFQILYGVNCSLFFKLLAYSINTPRLGPASVSQGGYHGILTLAFPHGGDTAFDLTAC